VQRQQTPSLILEQLRSLITDGTFAAGTQLREQVIADQLGVSRGPLREALARLIQEGLLLAEPHRGVFVIGLGHDDIRDIYRARAPIEEAAALEVGRRKDPETLRALGEIVDRMRAAERERNWREVVEIDLQFHQEVVAAAGSPRLSRMFSTLLAESRMCISALEPKYLEPGGTGRNKREPLEAVHRRLLGAMASGRRRDIVAEMREHMDLAVRDLTRSN
jgi:DNA-binding GntR family transcriptional regulator